MAIFGFVIVFLIMLYVSFVVVVGFPYLCALDMNFKGAVKFWWIVAMCVVGYLWYLLFHFAPFSVSITT